MGTIDLRSLEGDQVVIHYGGALTSVDAYTFGNSLIAFADTVRAVNAVFDPNQAIEIRVEALGDGSFRAIIKRVRQGLGGFLARGGEQIFWAAVAFVIFDKLIGKDPNTIINISSDQVEIIRGADKIIVPRYVYDQRKALCASPEVQKGVSRTFQVIENDDAIENFGLTANITDLKPVAQIQRDEFQLLSSPAGLLTTEGPKRQERKEKAILVILKAWLTSGNRKWSFEWNGIPVSAPITDKIFWRQLEDREFLIGAGDALNVVLRYYQDYDDEAGVWINDPNTFEVVEVLKHIPRGDRQSRIFE